MNFYLGIDVGSVSTNIALLNQNAEVSALGRSLWKMDMQYK